MNQTCTLCISKAFIFCVFLCLGHFLEAEAQVQDPLTSDETDLPVLDVDFVVCSCPTPDPTYCPCDDDCPPCIDCFPDCPPCSDCPPPPGTVDDFPLQNSQTCTEALSLATSIQSNIVQQYTVPNITPNIQNLFDIACTASTPIRPLKLGSPFQSFNIHYGYLTNTGGICGYVWTTTTINDLCNYTINYGPNSSCNGQMNGIWVIEPVCGIGITGHPFAFIEGSSQTAASTVLAYMECLDGIEAYCNGDVTQTCIANYFSAQQATNKTTANIPLELSVSNYPNPFQQATTIQYQLHENEEVTLSIFNTKGQQIASLVNSEAQNAGQYQYTFDAYALSEGVYFYRLHTSTQEWSGKMVKLP